MNADELSVGCKVHYTSGTFEHENGIVKSWSKDIAYVVYKCNNDWDNYQNYTGCATSLEDLTLGWV